MGQTGIAHRTLPACDYKPSAYNGPSRDEVLELRRRYCNPGVFAYYKEPLMIVDGHMQYLFDERGRRYLDCFAGIATVSCGHCHPEIIARAEAQMKRLQHTSTIYLHPLMPELGRRIAEKMPAGLDVTYFVNSGSEANDLAMTIARLYTGNYDILALQNAYHGAVSSVMGLTSHNTWKFPIPQGSGVHHVPCPDPYRSHFEGDARQISAKTARAVEDAIRYETPGKIAAFIAEPFQGVGGVTSGAHGYLPSVYESVRAAGGLCIADEVQTGFGRTGDHFWGFENFDVVPDIVTMAKAIGNGAPLAAVTTRREIAEVLKQKLHFNTFGGNPVSMAQGLAVLDVIEEDGLQENARVQGGRLKEGLLALSRKHPIIGDVRGKGLMLAFELVKDRDSKAPATQEAAAVLEDMKNRSVLIGKTGIFGNILRTKPPLCINGDDVEYVLDALDQSLTVVERKG